MLKKFERKVSTTIHTFFLFGLVSVGLGFLTLSNELFARLFIAVGFFLLGILFLHVAYHIQDLQNRLAEMIKQAEKPLVASALSAVARVAHVKRKKRTTKRKATAST